MSATVTVTAQIPKELSDLLSRYVEVDERSKSYFIKKGLELILRQRQEDEEDYRLGVEAWKEHVAEGSPVITREDVFGRK